MDTIDHLVSAIEDSIVNKNWYAALFLALTMPDVCASLSSPDGRTNGKRYAEWFDKYVGHNYIPDITDEEETFKEDENFLTPEDKAFDAMIDGMVNRILSEKTFLRGDDCYALRCSLLHQGTTDIFEQRARKVHDSFRFTAPVEGGPEIHSNTIDNALQLQVNVFCKEICEGVQAWKRDVFSSLDVSKRVADMITIDTMS